MIEVSENSDFTYSVSVGGSFLGEFRELTGKDLYHIEVLKKEHGDELPETFFLVEMISHLSEIDMEAVMDMPIGKFKALVKWFTKEILEGKVMTVYQFLEICFHLMKQRWDSSLEWLEIQPMSKLLTMVDILKKSTRKK
jgi:hypothetical protein